MRAAVDSMRTWLEERLPMREAAEFASHKTVPVHRLTVVYYFGGMTQREIAIRHGIPLGTVKTRTLLALRKLRSALQDEIGELC